MILRSHFLVFSLNLVLMALILIILSIFILNLVLWNRFQYWKSKNVPQAKPMLPFGNFQRVLFQQDSIGSFLNKLHMSSKEDLLGFYILHIPSILVRSPELVKRVLVTDYMNFQNRTLASDERADPIVSKLLLLLRNPEWKIMRQKISPAFTSSKIRGMSPHVLKSSDDLIDFLDRNHLEGPIEAKEACAKFATDLITSCAFGVEAQSFTDEKSRFFKAGNALVVTTIMNAIRYMIYFLLPPAVPIFNVPFFDRRSVKFLEGVFLETIKIREANGVKRGDLIDIIIELKKKKELPGGLLFEGNRIVAQAVQFFAAGFETNSSTLAYSLYELALNPDIQNKARQTVIDLIKSGSEINYDGSAQLNYLEYVLLEGIRKYPSLPFLDRKCNEDYHVPDTDIIIPAGTPMYISLLGLHYNEEYFPNPHVFDPERHCPEEVMKRPSHCFLPFGGGPHICIGERFALNALKIALAKILLNFKIEPCEDTEIPLTFAARAFALITTRGIKLNFIKIKQ